MDGRQTTAKAIVVGAVELREVARRISDGRG